MNPIVDYEILLDEPYTPEYARSTAELLDFIAFVLMTLSPAAWTRVPTVPREEPDNDDDQEAWRALLMSSLKPIAADPDKRQRAIISAQVTAAQLRAYSVPRS